MQSSGVRTGSVSREVRQARATLGLLLLPLPLCFLALLFGRYPILPGQVLSGLFAGARSLFSGAPVVDVADRLVVYVRFPRVLAAALVGANLAVAGAVYQGVFRNPLVEGKLLGVSSGAGLGAALAILLAPQPAMIQALAFAGGLGGVALTALLGSAFGGSILVFVIAGVLVDSFLSAVLGIIKYTADPLGTLPAITYWLLGGLSGVKLSQLVPLVICSGLGLTFFHLSRWRLNLLTLADQEGQALGIRVREARLAVVGMGTLLVASAVSVSGIVGWVGLLVPHAARTLVGPDYAHLIPASAGLGAALMVVLDTMARTLWVAEIPLGVLTGLLGAPLFLVLFLRFLRERGGWR